MQFLFVHQNFPGQFRHIALALADEAQHSVVALGDMARLKGRPALHPSINTLGYRASKGAGEGTHHYLRDLEAGVRRGQAVARIALQLKHQGFTPDVVVAHPAWGESMFLKDIFPAARLVCYFEFYYHAEGADLGFDPEFPASLDDKLRARVRNAAQLMALEAADVGISPTTWQQTRYPHEFRSKIKILHDGIETQAVCPDQNASLRIGGLVLTPNDEVVTYVARNLEPYRGFHIFMRALPALLQARPNAHVVILGGDDVSYGHPLPAGQSYRLRLSKEVGAHLDWSRVHFLGRVSYPEFLSVLRVSSVHVYLTYPFVLSWSMLEAMAAGCLLVASATSPVEEVVKDGLNGILVDFFDFDRLAETITRVLEHRREYSELRVAARRTVIERFDLRDKCVPACLHLLAGGGSVSGRSKHSR